MTPPAENPFEAPAIHGKEAETLRPVSGASVIVVGCLLAGACNNLLNLATIDLIVLICAPVLIAQYLVWAPQILKVRLSQVTVMLSVLSSSKAIGLWMLRMREFKSMDILAANMPVFLLPVPVMVACFVHWWTSPGSTRNSLSQNQSVTTDRNPAWAMLAGLSLVLTTLIFVALIRISGTKTEVELLFSIVFDISLWQIIGVTGSQIPLVFYVPIHELGQGNRFVRMPFQKSRMKRRIVE